jgi:protein SCO1/2
MTLLAALVLSGAASVNPRALEAPPALKEVGFDQKLGATLPLDAPFVDEAGREVRLGDYFGKKPVVLNLVYFDCPMLCTVSLNGLESALQVLAFLPGREFELVTISFDAKEGPALAAQKKRAHLTRLQRTGAEAGWHFLTGRPAAIQAVSRAVGFRYAWDEETHQFAHPAGLVVLTPDGRIARYLFGIEYAPKDLRLALVEAADGKVGGPVDQLLLYCYRYDPVTGRYGPAIMGILRLAAGLTMLALFGFIFLAWRRERRAARDLRDRTA